MDNCAKKLLLGAMVALHILIRMVDSILLRQSHHTQPCTESHLGIDVLSMPFASTTPSGWNPQVAMLMVCMGRKKRRKRPFRLNPDLLVA